MSISSDRREFRCTKNFGHAKATVEATEEVGNDGGIVAGLQVEGKMEGT